MLIRVGTTAQPASCAAAIRSSVSPVPCSIESMPGRDQPGQRVLAEHVRGDPRPELVRPGRSPAAQRVVGPGGREVADVAVDPVGGDLDPAVAGAPPAARPRRRGRRARPRRRGRGCSASVRAMCRPGPDQPRQVVARLHAAVVDRRAGVAQQQRPGGPVDQRLLGLLVRVGDVPAGRQADVAVGVDEARRDPAAATRPSRLSPRRPGEGQPAVERPRRRARSRRAGTRRAGAGPPRRQPIDSATRQTKYPNMSITTLVVPAEL